MAKTKATGSTKLGRESESKRLGVKLFDGEYAFPGNVIIRQRGTHFIAGRGVRRGGDDTLYAVAEGRVAFHGRTKKSFSGSRKKVTRVEVQPK